MRYGSLNGVKMYDRVQGKRSGFNARKEERLNVFSWSLDLDVTFLFTYKHKAIESITISQRNKNLEV